MRAALTPRLALALVLFGSPGLAQEGTFPVSGGGVTPSGTITVNDCAKWASASTLADAGGSCGGTGSPGGSSGQIQFNNGGAFGGVSVNGSGSVIEAAGTLSILSGKTLTASNSLTLAGTDGTTMTFPSSSQSIPGLSASNIFTNSNNFTSLFKVAGITNGVSGHVVDAGAAPTISSGFGTGPTIVPNGSFAFAITIGSSPGTTGVVAMNSTVTNGWICVATDFTTPSEQVRQTTYSTTAPGFTFYNWAGTATAPAQADVVGVTCRGS